MELKKTVCIFSLVLLMTFSATTSLLRFQLKVAPIVNCSDSYTAIPIGVNQTITDQFCPVGTGLNFTYTLNTRMDVQIEVVGYFGTDYHLYVKWDGTCPTINDYDEKSVTGPLSKENLPPGTYFFMVYDYQNLLNGTFDVTLTGYESFPVHNLDIGLKYETIQEAIDAPETIDGHAIFVEEGIYYEHVVVSKSLNLKGESRENTTFDGRETGTVVYVTANNVTISGFTIRNCGPVWTGPNGFLFPRYGIHLYGYGSSNCSVVGNIVTNNNGTGVFIERSHNNIISNNIITNNTMSYWGEPSTFPAYGIDLDGDNCIVSNNIIANNSGGIFLMGDNNIVDDNVVINNTHEPTEPPPYSPPFRELAFGINIAGARNSIINGNVVSDNSFGIFLVLDHSNDVGNVLRDNSMNDNRFNFGIYEYMNPRQEIDVSNTVNGKPIYYWFDQHDKHVPFDAGYVALINCTNIAVKNLNLTDNFQGIFLYNTVNSTVDECVVTDNFNYGVGLWESENCIISDNIITNNNGTEYEGYGFGIRGWYSQKIYVTNNIIAHARDGINSLWRNWTVSGNTVAHNNRGIIDSSSATYSDNTIFHNNFINNTEQVFSFVNASAWDNGLEGNFWSDYDGTDTNQDGIGETPHIIRGDAKDNYPLMGMFSDFNATSEYHIQTICNSTISDSQFNGTAISFNVSGENGTTGFCRTCVPTALMNGTYKVFVNSTEVPHTLLPYSNSTHSYLYFTYNHSTLEVVIIPEFPSFLILPLFMIATLLAVIVYRRKHSM